MTDLLEINDLLLQHRLVTLSVSGWSMYPTLSKGDRLTVDPVPAGLLQSGDLVLFVHRFPDGPRLICHRLIRTMTDGQPSCLVTKGDAVADRDPPLPAAQVLGRVIAIRRPWWRACPGSGALAMRLDQGRARLVCWLAGLLESLQARRLYRLVMRHLLARFWRPYIGIPEGSRWYRYEPVRSGSPFGLAAHPRLRLVAKLAGAHAGDLQLRAEDDGYELEALNVRLRYRGLGAASRLLSLADVVASASRARALRVTIERDDRPARRLFDKMGFRETGASSDSVILVREIQGASS